MKIYHILIFVLILPMVYGNQIGDNDFIDGQGIFNEYVNDTTLPVALPSSQIYPILDDINNDSTNEVIVFTDTSVVLLGYNMTELDSVTTSCNNLTQAITFDIDGNGENEIIFWCRQNSDIYIINFTDDNLQIQQQYGENYAGADGQVACGNTEECLVMYGTQATPGSGQILFGGFFNSTNHTGRQTIHASLDTGYCFSRWGSVLADDVDNDGTNEYILWVLSYGTAGNHYELRIINISDTTVSEEKLLDVTYDPAWPGGNCRSNGVTDVVTNPLIHNFAIGGNKEIVVGVQSGSGFKMNMYDDSLNLIDTFPELLNGQGSIKSNIVRGNFYGDGYTDTAQDDFAVLGYDDTLNYAQLLVGSKRTDALLEGNNIGLIFGGSVEYNDTHNLIYSVQTSQDETDGENLNEISTPYGIYKLTEVLTLPSITGSPIYTPPYTGAIIPYEHTTGHADLWILTSTNLWKVSDGFEPTPSYIPDEGARISPHVDDIWAQNTTAIAIARVVDNDGDLVCVNITFYENTTRQDSSGWQCGQSGTTFQHTITANETISNGYITIYTNSSDFPLQGASIMKTFNVRTYGVTYGDSTWIYSIEDGVVEESIAGVTDPQANNSLTQTVNSMQSSTGLGTTVLWLIIMVTLGVTVMFALSHYAGMSDGIGWAGGIATFGLLFIVGVIQGYIGYGILIVLFLLGLGWVGMFIATRLNASGG